ncbi:MAG: hypothetical protein ABII06_22320, partial [Pseudomonadota bacterium]
LMSTALRFSSRCMRFLLLGIGRMSSPWAMSQARETWAGVADFSRANAWSCSSSFRFCPMLEA